MLATVCLALGLVGCRAPGVDRSASVEQSGTGDQSVKTLAIVGNSVGGNMTAVVALMAKSKGGPKLKCQILFWPVTNANLETGSYNEYTDGYLLTKGMMKWFWDAYTTDPEKRKEIT